MLARLKPYIILCLSLLLCLDCFSEARDVVLKQGEVFKKQLFGQSNVWIESPQVIKASSSGATLIIKANKKGSTLVKINDEFFNIHVLSLKDYYFYESVKILLNQKMGLKLKLKKGEIYITGELLRYEDYLDIVQMANEARYIFSAKINKNLQNLLQNNLTQILKNQNLPSFNILFSDNLQIKINENDSNFDQLNQIFLKHGIEAIKTKTSIMNEPLIKVSITIAEVKKSFDQTYGIKWPSSFETNQVIDSLSLNLQALESNGQAKVLANPNLICKSGKDAEFLAGGEIPIKVMSLRNTTVTWKKYGIILKIKPVADWSGKISLNLESEISTIDGSQVVDGVPGFLTNRVQSHFDINSNQTLVLSGLIKSEQAKSVEGLPALSQLPIFGRLFSSQNFKENKSELLIFVKPEIIKSE